MDSKRWLFVVISVFMLVGMACNLPGSVGGNPTLEPASAVENQEENVEAPAGELQPEEGQVAPMPQVIVVTATPEPTLIPSNPIGLWEGLSSLNSYRLTIRMINTGPTEVDKSANTFLIEMGSDGDSSHTHYEIFASSADEPAGDTSITDQYQVGNITCNYSEGDEATIEEANPMAQEIIDVWFKMLDLLPMVNDPVFVGEEMVNGVMTNHFTFALEGLGVESGAEVVSKGGEYWLAQDGQYVVKYSVIMETRDGPVGDANTQTLHSEFYIEVMDINQEVAITLPGICQ
jgi:hypothetical protein